MPREYTELEPMELPNGRGWLRLFNDHASKSTFSVDEADGQTVMCQLAKCRARFGLPMPEEEEITCSVR